MVERIFRETVFSLSPYKINIIGDDPKTYFFKVKRTEVDGTKREIVSEINQVTVPIFTGRRKGVTSRTEKGFTNISTRPVGRPQKTEVCK